jgi:hypothetical protein
MSWIRAAWQIYFAFLASLAASFSACVSKRPFSSFSFLENNVAREEVGRACTKKRKLKTNHKSRITPVNAREFRFSLESHLSEYRSTRNSAYGRWMIVNLWNSSHTSTTLSLNSDSWEKWK